MASSARCESVGGDQYKLLYQSPNPKKSLDLSLVASLKKKSREGSEKLLYVVTQSLSWQIAPKMKSSFKLCRRWSYLVSETVSDSAVNPV